MNEQDLGEMARRLTAVLMRGLGSRSAWALDTGIRAAETEGIVGVLTLRIPARPKDHVDVMFTAGPVDVVARWGDAS